MSHRVDVLAAQWVAAKTTHRQESQRYVDAHYASRLETRLWELGPTLGDLRAAVERDLKAEDWNE